MNRKPYVSLNWQYEEEPGGAINDRFHFSNQQQLDKIILDVVLVRNLLYLLYEGAKLQKPPTFVASGFHVQTCEHQKVSTCEPHQQQQR